MKSLDEFERELELAIKTVRLRLEIGLAKIGALAEPLAVNYIGHEMSEWAPLAPSTIDDKSSKGYPVPYPLLRTGEMRDSIRMEVSPDVLEMVLGATDEIAVYQEMGTSKIPPRPFLALAMKNTLPYAGDVFGEIAVSLLTGRKL
jgi:hypothetical protein